MEDVQIRTRDVKGGGNRTRLYFDRLLKNVTVTYVGPAERQASL
jgi:hypothetical protein